MGAILELASMLDTTPAMGSPEMPSIGSAQHHSGECKPCAFFWKAAGCGNGADCIYCHLCDANEKKRRQKEKKKPPQSSESDSRDSELRARYKACVTPYPRG